MLVDVYFNCACQVEAFFTVAGLCFLQLPCQASQLCCPVGLRVLHLLGRVHGEWRDTWCSSSTLFCTRRLLRICSCSRAASRALSFADAASSSAWRAALADAASLCTHADEPAGLQTPPQNHVHSGAASPALIPVTRPLHYHHELLPAALSAPCFHSPQPATQWQQPNFKLASRQSVCTWVCQPHLQCF